MGKRILAWLLAAAMVVGMIPASPIAVFAADTQPEKVINAVYGEAAVNGTMDEVRWLLTGQLTDEVSFGTMYKAGYLYIGLNAAVDDLAVTLNGVAVKTNSKKGTNATETWVSMAEAGLELTGYDQTASLKVTAGGNTWEGLVRFASSGWLHVKQRNASVRSGRQSPQWRNQQRRRVQLLYQ